MSNDTDWPTFVNIPLGTWIPFVDGGEDSIDVCQELAAVRYRFRWKKD